MENQQDELVDLIAKLPSPSPGFRIWAADAFQTGHLGWVIEALIQTGEVKTVEEALQYLAQKSQDLSLKESLLTSSDFWGGSRQKVRAWRLRNAVRQGKGEKNKEENGATWDISRFHGIIGHLAIPDLLTGKLLDLSAKEKEIPWTDIFSQKTPRTQTDFLKDMKRAWQSLLPLAGGNFETLVSFKTESLGRFYNMLGQIFGEYTERIKRGEERETAFLYFLTLMSWATAVMYYRKEKKYILFQEMPVIAKRFGLSGGRADALRIDNRYFSPQQKKLLEAIAQERYETSRQRKTAHSRTGREDNNIGDFFHNLQHRLGRGRLEVKVIDWKFAVGDGSSKIVQGPDGKKRRQYNIITYDEIKDAPLKHHLWQVKRYLVLASLGYHFKLTREEGVKTHWPEDVYFPRGRIIYFLPTTLPVVHEIVITAEDQQTFFDEEVVQKWSVAQRRMAVRSLDNSIVGDVMRALRSKATNNHRPVASQSDNNKSRQMPLPLFPLVKVPTAIDEMANKGRKFLDPDRIVEIAGKKEDGQVTYRMHLDHLLTALREGRVVSAGFQPGRRGFVRCFLPGHQDTSASFHIDPEKGIFKCFGKCGVGGTILPASIPDDLSVPMRLTRWVQRAYSQTISYESPTEQHIKIMRAAQEILQSSFKGSQGEKYLVKERCLDAYLALEKGIGFGTNLLIEGLLDASFTLDDLIYYGFVGFLNRFDRYGDISPILEKRGLHVAGNREKEGYPYSVLYDRVTFPLSLFGKTNNFYGRIIRGNDRRFFHRKLTVEHTGVAHGGFNMGVAEDPSIREVFLVEGCCDALALMQMGFPSAIGMIGVDNRIILETLARYDDKKIAVALDYDEGGKGKTQGYYIEKKDGTRDRIPGLLEILERKGKARQDLRDFTAEYVDSHPEIQEMTRRNLVDWNDWWKEIHRNKNIGR